MINVGIIVDNELNSDIRVRREIEILKKGNYNLHVLCFAFDNKSYSEIEGINIRRIPIKKRFKNILFFFFNRIPLYEYIWKNQIKKFAKNNSIDILHVHDLYMSKSVYLALKQLNSKIPIVLDLHENFPSAIDSYNWTKGIIRNFLSKPSLWIEKEKKYLSYASKLIVLSESFKQKLLAKYSFLESKDIVDIPNVIDIKQFETFKIDSKILKSNKVTLFYFGVVAERRGIFDTISVFRKCLDTHENIELLIIGPIDKSDKKNFNKVINNPKLKDKIIYKSWINLSEIVTYMNISDICLSPLIKNDQHESGVANKIFQYLFGAKPLIVSNCKPQKELVESFNCGLVYSTLDEYLICIKKLVANKELRETLGLNGRINLYKTYDNKLLNNKLLDLYEKTSLLL